MSEKPFDPAAPKANTEKHEHTDTLNGQEGYGVQYEHSRYQNEEMREVPPTGHSGSYEQSNLGRKTIHELDADADMSEVDE